MADNAEKLMSFDEAIKRFDPVWGLEVHVELSTNTKLFCPAHYEFGATPNTELTPVSLGLPGSLPVINKQALDDAIRLGLALHCHINEWSQWSRKNYFYPDMPRDYQITQGDYPLNGEGYLDVKCEDGTKFRVPILRAHVEDDAGKNTHIGGANGRIEGADHSLIDYNRAGVPLVEIVSKPVEGTGAKAAEIAGAYVREIREIAKALGVSHGKLEQGNMRADVNVSLRRSPSDPLGTRSETKNVNSFRGIERTLIYEIRRQATILSHGGSILQETRHWDEATQTTTNGRLKSDANDYRYFPDPDLMWVHTSAEHVEALRKTLPEMPWVRQARLQKEWGFDDRQMHAVLNAGAVDVIDQTVQAGASASGAAKWWLGEIARVANEQSASLDELPVSPQDVADVEEMIKDGKLNNSLAIKTMDGVLNGEGSPADVVKKHGYKIVEGGDQLEGIVKDALAKNPDVAAKLKAGNMKPMGVIIGAVMRATHGQADAKAVRQTIMKIAGNK